MSLFGNPSDRLRNWYVRLDQSRREILLASTTLLFVIAIGTAGYRVIEGWPWMDGLFMTFITLTTIGFAEVRPLSDIGRFFTIFIALTGIGIVTFVAARSAQLLLASDRLRERQKMKKIDQLTDHYIVCGYGRVGQRLTEDLEHAGRDYVVIDQSDEEIEQLQDEGRLYVQGNAEDEDTLNKAGIDRAFGVILALPDDSSNVFVTLTAREMNPNVFILARTVDHRNRSKLLHAGADKVIAPSEVGADRMAQVILRPNVDQFLERVLRAGALSLQIDEVEVLPGAPLAGQTLAESNFRQQYDAIVIGMIDQSEGNMMRFNPNPTSRIQEGDILIVLGDPEMIRTLRDQGCTPAT
ncbi:potassium transporter TrkA [Longibacter salinarum]|uniref:Potassium transporter TrkA n=1 Tax=Longibacter salinarum TaxID=1850348 RepID=A0A2A8CXL2_9BACT|nr:potassium channel protein [Longibacter salinarum]PEN13452.1 potassium transporter TrkA [Longibacter salinarum]